MAWIDDRIWCHPKMADLSDAAFRGFVNGIAYSTGFGTRGVLTDGMQHTVRVTAKVRRELVAAGAWDELEDGSVAIHDWANHNSKRDDRREADKERKRVARAADKARLSNGTSAGQSAGQSTGSTALPARVEGSEGSEGNDGAVELPGTAPVFHLKTMDAA